MRLGIVWWHPFRIKLYITSDIYMSYCPFQGHYSLFRKMCFKIEQLERLRISYGEHHKFDGLYIAADIRSWRNLLCTAVFQGE